MTSRSLVGPCMCVWVQPASQVRNCATSGLHLQDVWGRWNKGKCFYYQLAVATFSTCQLIVLYLVTPFASYQLAFSPLFEGFFLSFNHRKPAGMDHFRKILFWFWTIWIPIIGRKIKCDSAREIPNTNESLIRSDFGEVWGFLLLCSVAKIEKSYMIKMLFFGGVFWGFLFSGSASVLCFSEHPSHRGYLLQCLSAGLH